MPTEEQAAVFMIDGKPYEVPTIDTLTMGDAVTVYEYTGLGLDEIGESRHPGVLLAFAHIAYKRAHPDMNDRELKEMIEGTPLLEAFSRVPEEDDARPPDSATSTSPPTSGNSSEAPNGSGSSSPKSSGEPDETPSPTGTTGSETPLEYVPST